MEGIQPGAGVELKLSCQLAQAAEQAKRKYPGDEFWDGGDR